MDQSTYKQCIAALCAGLLAISASHADDPIAPRYGVPRKLAELENEEIGESSGLAASRRHAGVFWTHNDSGDEARIYAFNSAGRHLASVKIQGAGSIDWEDMASFVMNERPFLLLADVGDNGHRRTAYQLYVVEEPQLDAKAATVDRTIEFQYEGGAFDCEAVGVDTTTGSVLLVAKVLGLKCGVFQLPITGQRQSTKQTAIAIGTLNLALATAMDISPDGRRALVTTYLHGHEFTRREGESWKGAFARPARGLTLPERPQGEAACYGQDGRTIYLTSEKLPTPFWEVPVRDDPTK